VPRCLLVLRSQYDNPAAQWGGVDCGSDEGARPAIAELYDQSNAMFTSIGNATGPHEYSTSTLLPDGTVMIAGSELPDG